MKLFHFFFFKKPTSHFTRNLTLLSFQIKVTQIFFQNKNQSKLSLRNQNINFFTYFNKYIARISNFDIIFISFHFISPGIKDIQYILFHLFSKFF